MLIFFCCAASCVRFHNNDDDDDNDNKTVPALQVNGHVIITIELFTFVTSGLYLCCLSMCYKVGLFQSKIITA